MMTTYLNPHGLVIRIFVDPNLLEIRDGLDKIPYFPGVEFKAVIKEPLPEILSYCDIVILKDPLPMPVYELKKVLRPDAKLVLCINPENEGNIGEDDLLLLDDIWINPLTINRTVLRIANLTAEILRTQEAELYKKLLNTLMDAVPDMIWFKNLEGKHLKVNKAFSHAAGKTRKMIEGKSHSEIWDGEESDCMASEMEVVNASEQRSFEEILVIDDKPHHLRTNKTPIMGPDGAIVGTLGVAQDLTNILNLNMEIGIFMEAMPFPLLLTSDNGKITHVNKKFLEMFGECRDDIIGAYYNTWSDWAFENTSEFIGDTLCFTHDDKKLLLHITETSLQDSFGEHIGMVRAFLDVTSEKELEAQVWKAANVDPLTGVANRFAFSEWVKNKKQELTHLIYLDLDNFKQVNDAYGHEAGDEALCRLSDSIQKVFPDDFVARLGGDEFVICICREMSMAELERMGNSLQKIANGYFQASEYFKNISLSLGIRPNCPESTPMEQLIREADEAMYKAKINGKARVEFWKGENN